MPKHLYTRIFQILRYFLAQWDRKKQQWNRKKQLAFCITGKPDLVYLEFQLADHCNLNCKGCTHYSPLAPSNFADLQQYETDLWKLKHLFKNIQKIRLMGGEPLLHPDYISFIKATKTVFPESNIHLVTNGILLPKASPDFWDTCRKTGATIDLTVYPPIKNAKDLRDLCKSERVKASVSDVVEEFHAHHNLAGNSIAEKAFRICQNKFFCPLLKEGRLYTCAMPAYVHYFNAKFGYEIAADKGIDIYAPGMTGLDILKQLSKPIETCKWCSYDFAEFPWSRGNHMPTDWDASIDIRVK